MSETHHDSQTVHISGSDEEEETDRGLAGEEVVPTQEPAEETREEEEEPLDPLFAPTAPAVRTSQTKVRMSTAPTVKSKTGSSRDCKTTAPTAVPPSPSVRVTRSGRGKDSSPSSQEVPVASPPPPKTKKSGKPPVAPVPAAPASAQTSRASSKAVGKRPLTGEDSASADRSAPKRAKASRKVNFSEESADQSATDLSEYMYGKAIRSERNLDLKAFGKSPLLTLIKSQGLLGSVSYAAPSYSPLIKDV